VQAAEELTTVARSRPDVPTGDDLGVVFLIDGGAGDGCFVAIPFGGDRGRLVSGCPPRSCVDMRRLRLLVSSPAVAPEVSLSIRKS
jgi:hypothetical protein